MGLGRNQLEQERSKLESNDQGELYYDFPMIEGVAQAMGILPIA